MKGLALVASLLLISATSWAVTKEVPLNYDDAWQKAVRGFASEGIEFSVIDKETGIIQGSKETNKDRRYFNCPYDNNRISWSYVITVTIQEKDEQSSIVSIIAKGLLNGHENSHFLFIKTGTEIFEDACASTGQTEKDFLQEIFGVSVSISRNEELIMQLQRSSHLLRNRASRAIYKGEKLDKAVYDAVADAIQDQLGMLNKRSPREMENELSYHAYALSKSGDPEYIPLLNELTQSSNRKVAKAAKKAKEMLLNQ
jgi:hypothetical protein